MKRLVLTVGAIIACASFVVAQDKSDVPADWTRITICDFSFYGPRDLKKTGMTGADSCVAQFVNNDMSIYLDYGQFGGPTARGNELEWKQEMLSVGGKDAQLTTFVDATHSNSGLKYIASLYVVVKAVEVGSEGGSRATTLMMSITFDRRTDRNAAVRIFRTIRFE